MNVFAVVAVADDVCDRIDAVVAQKFPERFLKAGKTLWFISDSGTTQTVAEAMDVYAAQNPMTSVIVLAVTSYNGRAPAPVWEWLLAQLEKSSK
jgi:hypothetical protein